MCLETVLASRACCEVFLNITDHAEEKEGERYMATKVTDLMVGDWIHNNYTNDNYQVWRTFFSQATNYGKRMDATLEDCNCDTSKEFDID